MAFIPTIKHYAQYYTQHNNVIYYCTFNEIRTYNMTYPYSQNVTIPINNITLYWDNICLSADINGNLFLSSGGFGILGQVMNYYGYNMNTNIWQTFRHSEYWSIYNYDMRGMACIVHDQVLYTFGGQAGGASYRSEYYGSNMISYHDVSDYNKPFLLNGYSLWNKSSQDLKPFGGNIRAVSVNELIYIIGGYSWNNNTDGSCCIRGLNDVQIFDPLNHTIKGKIDGIEPLPFNQLWATTCHFRSKTYTIDCFGGWTGNTVTNNWIYSNVLVTESPSKTPTNTPSKTPTKTPTLLPSKTPTNTPSLLPSKTPTNTPSILPSNTPSHFVSNIPSDSPSNTPSYVPSKETLSPSKTPTNTPSTFFNANRTIVIIMGSIICILVTLILYIIVYYKHKHKNGQQTTASEIVMSGNSIPSASLPDNNSVTIKIAKTSPIDKQSNPDNTGEQQFNESYIKVNTGIHNDPKRDNNDIKDTYMNNEIITHGIDDKTDELIANQLQINQFDLHSVTSGRVSLNAFDTNGSNNVNINHVEGIQETS